MRRFLVVASFAESLIGFRLPLIQALQNAGFEVHVAAPGARSESHVLSKLQGMGVVVHEYPLARKGTNPVRDFVSILKLTSLMRRVRPEFFLGYTIKPVIYGTISARIARVPRRFALVTGLGQSFQECDDRVGRLEWLLGKLLGIAFKCAHKVIFQNPDDADLMRRRGILPAGAQFAVVNGSGVDVTEYASRPVSAEVPTFLLVARLLESKGVKIYERAAQRIKQSVPNVRFLLAGWIDETGDSITASQLQEWQRAGHIDYLGKLDNVHEALSRCSVFVLPTFYREGTPRSILESLSVGRAIITTDTPGCRETVEQGVNGFLIEPRSVDALESAMMAFVEDPDLARRMAVESRRIALDKYDVNLVNRAMLTEMHISDSRNRH